MIESQLDYVLQALRFMDASGARVIDARAAAQTAYNERVQRDFRGSVWTTGADGYRPLLAPAVRDQVIPHLRASGRLAWPG